MKHIKFYAAALVSLALLAGCGSTPSSGGPGASTSAPTSTPPQSTPAASLPAAPDPDLLNGTYTVEIAVQDYGTITAELYADTAPITVTNFVTLAESGFYDGLTFHRIIPGFMIQGGDPEGTGGGGPGYQITGEFANNGIQNDLLHTRGVLSMARQNIGNDTAGSQFFIVHEDAPHLDGEYAAFGMVTEGMEVVDAICDAAIPGSNGSIAAADQPVIERITVLENDAA